MDITKTTINSALALILSSALFGCGNSSSDIENDSQDTETETVDPCDTTDCSSSVDPAGDPLAPYSYTRYQSILSESNLQVSDPDGEEGNKSDVIKDGEFEDYYSDYFYVDSTNENLVFEMSGYKMRSEVRVIENFDITETETQRTLLAEIKPIDIEASMGNCSGQ